MTLSPPVALQPEHRTDEFDCGQPALNNWLRRYALQNQRADAARTFVVCTGNNRIAGYYSLATGAVEPDEAPDRVKKGLARHPIPVMVLARLAVDCQHHGSGIGSALVRDAILRTLQVAEHAGIRAIVVHAKDERVRRFYERLDFEASPLDPLQLMLLLKDARRTLNAVQR